MWIYLPTLHKQGVALKLQVMFASRLQPMGQYTIHIMIAKIYLTPSYWSQLITSCFHSHWCAKMWNPTVVGVYVAGNFKSVLIDKRGYWCVMWCPDEDVWNYPCHVDTNEKFIFLTHIFKPFQVSFYCFQHCIKWHFL